ncbi:hypothetical protein [Variovorax sp. N23]|uniref:hypothetical protein n=1 Tax=Variovorax sp. N23 TaxID=2980555 RepID=UPI0021C93AE0|nr:hypothetical protein [Variovorax sp. N23]MCU4121802.1 hypothetical protein [Variovorax sp. N23]
MILVKTETGQQVFKDRSIRLTPRQRSAFILFDGRRSVGDILTACEGVTAQDVDQMIELGLLGQTGQTTGQAVPSAPQSVAVAAPALEVGASDAGRSLQQRYKDAYPVATQLTGSLGLRGFRLNLAVEGTSSYEDLLALAPKIRASVGPEKAAVLDRALGI